MDPLVLPIIVLALCLAWIYYVAIRMGKRQ